MGQRGVLTREYTMANRDEWGSAVDGWSGHAAPPSGQPSDPAGLALAAAAGRVLIEVVACRTCGSARMRRTSSHGIIAWWRCGDCGAGQKEGLMVGRNAAHF